MLREALEERHVGELHAFVIFKGGKLLLSQWSMGKMISGWKTPTWKGQDPQIGWWARLVYVKGKVSN
jgi:hypothetical protein